MILAEPVFTFRPTAKHVVDWQPPQPDEDHEWDGTTKRWQLKEEVVRARHEKIIAQEVIDKAESGSLRSMREALLLVLPEGETKSRLRAADDQIAAQRPKLKKPT
jgi:hypothetical protein